MYRRLREEPVGHEVIQCIFTVSWWLESYKSVETTYSPRAFPILLEPYPIPGKFISRVHLCILIAVLDGCSEEGKGNKLAFA